MRRCLIGRTTTYYFCAAPPYGTGRKVHSSLFFCGPRLGGRGELCRAIIGSFRPTECSCLFHLLKAPERACSWRPFLVFLPPWGRCARISISRPAGHGGGLGSAPSQMQLSITACLLGLSLGQIVLGPLSDARGRKLPLLVSLAVFIVPRSCARRPQALPNSLPCASFRGWRAAAAWCFPAPWPATCSAARS